MTQQSLAYWAGLWLTVSIKGTAVYLLGTCTNLTLFRHRPAWRAFVWLGAIGSFAWLTILELIGGRQPWLADLVPATSTVLRLAAHAYLLIAVALIGMIVHSAIRLSLLKTYASPLPVELMMPDANAAGTAAELLKRVRLYSSGQVSVPTSFGVLRPAIALPPAPRGTIYRQLIQAALVFELIVVLRFDALWTLLIRIVQCAYFPHPLVWLANKQLCAAREQACDRWTVRAIADAGGYESDLLAMANTAQVKPVPMSLDTPMIGAGLSSIHRRIGLMQSDDRPESVSAWPGIAVLVGGMTLLALLASVGGASSAPVISVRVLLIGITAALSVGVGLAVTVLAAGIRKPQMLPPLDGLAGRSRYTLAECVEHMSRELQDLQLILGTAARRLGPVLLVIGILAATITLWIVGWYAGGPIDRRFG